MRILSIDTSSDICSTAILDDEKVVDEIVFKNGKTHSENLMPIINEVLEKNNMKLSDFDLLSCVVGPGSFTGIRIGVASIKAMAEVNQIPIASVTSLETLARIDEKEKIKIVLIDAKNNQVYCGVFDEFYNKIDGFFADDILVVLENLKKYENSICLGNGAILHRELIMQNMKNVKFSEMNEQLASNAGKIAYKKYLNNDLKNADNILPIYLRKSQAERLKEKAN